MTAAFQHMVTLLSFVLALGISHQLFTVVELVRAGSRVQWSWVHGIWMFNCFITVIAWWIGLYDLHTIVEWPVASVLFNFAGALSVFLGIAFVCPKVPQEGTLDLWKFHLAHRHQYIGFTTANVLVAAGDALYYGYFYSVPLQYLQAAIFVFIVLASSIALFTTDRRAQISAAILVAVLFFTFFFFGDPVLR